MEMIQKKGNPHKMHGKLTAYARVSVDSHGYEHPDSPLQAMINSGYLVAQGNYRDQNSLKDFLMQELGTSIDDEEGMKQFVEGLGGIEGALDPDKFREKINHLEEIEEFIPTPAKMVHFQTEEEILEQDGDVFYLGEYSNPANANLAVNAATILYQAQYRESQIHDVRSEIDSMINGLGDHSEIDVTPANAAIQQIIPGLENEILNVVETVERRLMKEFIPELLLAVESGQKRETAENKLKAFLNDYAHQGDVERLIELTENRTITDTKNRLIMLYCQKIDALKEEMFDQLSAIVKEIALLEERLRSEEEE